MVRLGLLLLIGAWLPWAAAQAETPAHTQAQIITGFASKTRQIALTFDGCEAPNAPAYLDQHIVAILERHQVPATLFVTGLFALRNAHPLAQLAASGRIQIENHSFSHPAHFQRLDPAAQADQIAKTDQIIHTITGRTPRFFRFPGGNYDDETLNRVQATHHRVVHWRWPSGDPAKNLTPDRLTQWVSSQTRAGDILIFHINGRAPATAQALEKLIPQWQAQGYQFVTLDQALP